MDTLSPAQEPNGAIVAPTPAQLALLSRVVRDVCRAARLSREDTEDFTQSVQLRLLERGYDAFRRFQGRSSLKTYLTVVVRRMLLDWQDHAYGKWRPTATALRLGTHAVQLERLINRDNYSIHEAVQHVSVSQDAPSTAELRRIAERLPRRPHRRTIALEHAPVPRVDFSDPVAESERRAKEQQARLDLERALTRLSPQDRQLLDLRFRYSRSVPAIARLLHMDTKALYRRLGRVLKVLRARLAELGVEGLVGSSVH
jgi:RNA polymerase sigma factor (sigma-70 family)